MHIRNRRSFFVEGRLKKRQELLDHKLFLLIPFHILVYKNQFVGYNKNEKDLEHLQQIYQNMVKTLGRLCSANKLTEEEVTDILRVSAEMVDKVAANCEKVRKAIGDILRGQAYELPTDRLIRQGALDTCIQLVKKGILTLAQAATQLGMSEEELAAKMS